MIKAFLISLSILFIYSCHNEDSSQQFFTLLDSSSTNISFSNDITDFANASINTYDYFYNGGGVGIGDFNNDGFEDIYFTGNQVSNKLYLNNGDLTFTDITNDAGVSDDEFWSTGVSVIDINDDGWLDLYVSHSGPPNLYPNKHNSLFINDGNSEKVSFTESSRLYGLNDNSYTTQVAFLDYDLDGDLDMFMMGHADFMNRFRKISGQANKEQAIRNFLKKGKNYDLVGNRLYERREDNKFYDVTEPSKIKSWGYGLGLVVSDLNDDGWPDIYVSNDYYIPDLVFVNQQDGTFKESNKQLLNHNSQFGMGADIRDVNNDGLNDIAVVDMTAEDRVRNKTLMRPMSEQRFWFVTRSLGYQDQYMFNSFQLNHGNGSYGDIAQLLRVANTDWSWSSLLVDLDQDGYRDYWITNGFRKDTKNRDIQSSLRESKVNDPIERLNAYPSVPLTNYVFKNGADLSMINVSEDWGFTQTSFSNGAAYADLDNDGDVELIVNNIDDKAFIYRNNSNSPEYIELSFDGQMSESLILNCRIEAALVNGQMYSIEVNPIRGYQSSMSRSVHLYQDHDSIQSIKLTLSTGEVALYESLDSKYLEIEKDDFSPLSKREEDEDPIFNILDSSSYQRLDYRHRENPFWDFKDEVLLPHKLSRLGPALCKGDIDGNGLEDVFIGGPINQAGSLFLQFEDGFVERNSATLQADSKFEDLGAVFFDLDNDGDLDLYVCSGGNEFAPNSRLLQDRIYLNNGFGQFNRSKQDGLAAYESSSTVIETDIDQDGDLDLFVGSRNIPSQYPKSGRSRLLLNENGIFIDKTLQFFPQSKGVLGMVTDAVWIDLNNDGLDDLIVVGEWMGIEVFINEEDHFVNHSNEFLDFDDNGWWFSIDKADLDNDGDHDLVLGNLGLNNKFHPDEDKPLKLYYNDFDDNGSGDIVLAKTIGDKLFPTRGKDCSTEQMPFIRDKFPSYSDFANAQLSDILEEDKMKDGLTLSVSDFSSILLENRNGVLVKRELPRITQISPIMSSVIMDVNDDSLLDIIIAGNYFDTEIETAPYDSGAGHVLINRGNWSFDVMNNRDSGLRLNCNLRELIFLDSGLLVAACNDDDMQTYEFKLN